MPTLTRVIWEKKLYMLVPLKPHMWLRLTHDIDIHWCQSRKDLHEFLDKVYAFHKTITFTSEISNDNHVFLDTMSHIEGASWLRIFIQNQQTVTRFCSKCHCCKNIPYSLALRKMICSQEADYERRPNELSSHLCRWGYQSKNVDDAITKASSIQRHELLKYKSNTICNTFYSNIPPWSPQNTRNWQALANHWNKHTAQLYFPWEMKLMIAFRRPKSLKDILVRAKVKPRQDSSKGESRPYNASRCQIRSLIPIAQTFKSKSGAISTIKGCHTCKTSNAVYMKTCNSLHLYGINKNDTWIPSLKL